MERHGQIYIAKQFEIEKDRVFSAQTTRVGYDTREVGNRS